VTELQPIDDSTLALLKFERFETLFDNTGDSQSASIRLKAFEVRACRLVACGSACVVSLVGSGLTEGWWCRRRGWTTLASRRRPSCVRSRRWSRARTC
jgi:hypothetical protein